MIISNYMKEEHRECDTLFAGAEEAVALGEWEVGEECFLAFANETLTHFKKEEEELFPAFEAQTGSTEGPTQVMRFEHEQVKGLIGKMAQSLESQDRDAYLSLAESMMILLQQHNMKEEQMLYAMCDRVMPSELKEETLAKMKDVAL
ncbi:MAG: hemerythrin domain-containing protein [Campylobacterota bacterium]|nr:hemerythrin domain-containing protein [Campylobacterota bacterium]